MPLDLPVIGGDHDNWGGKNNANLTYLDGKVDEVIAGTRPVTVPTIDPAVAPTAAGRFGVDSSGRLWRSIRVSNINYWAPASGTHVFRARQTITQSMADSTTVVLTWDAIDRNILTAYDAGQPTRFTPKVPGIYRLDGAITFPSNTTGYRALTWQVNGANIQGSGTIQPPASTTPSISARPVEQYLNGVTDYITLSVAHTAGVSLSTSVGSGTYRPTISALYLGL